ncbi:unnamed protein product [Rotaria socialis]|uniref:Reverse transcriptase domain-containing protein n=1 Tax=Rotaria socialis TaxID=392032 RepID=A0A820RSU9_9BILA|nr:unnamed protein product [Rotaria socialis]
MSNQETNNTKVNNDVQEVQELPKQRPRNFYRKRPGSERKNQDLGEDETRPSNDDDTQKSNNSDDQENHVNNTRGRGGRRGGFRGRGRFSRGIPFYGDYYQAYSHYANYMNGADGMYPPPGGYYGPSYHGDLSEQDGTNDYPVRGNRGFRGGRGRRDRRRAQVTKNETDENNTTANNNEQQPGENADPNKHRNPKRRQRRPKRETNENDASSEQQQKDGAVTDDQQKDENTQGSADKPHKKSSRQRRRRNTNASQNGTETEGHPKSDQVKKPKDDETIVKNVLRFMVNKVARRLAPRYRRQSHQNKKDATDNATTDVEKPQTRTTSGRRGRRGGGGGGGRLPGNGYFMEHGYYDPYGMTPYYYGMYYGYPSRGFGGRGRGGRGRGRGRFRQRGGANKENQPQHNSEKRKTEDSTPVDDSSQSKAPVAEQFNTFPVGCSVEGVTFAYGSTDFYHGARDKFENFDILALMYADDLAALTQTLDDLKLFIEIFENVTQAYGLTMSVKKTCVMSMQQFKEGINGKIVKNQEVDIPDIEITIRNQKIETVDSFSYLGCWVCRDQRSDKEIESRLTKSATAFNMLRNVIWHRKTISIEAKLRIFRACVLPVLLFGSEVWSLTAVQENRISTFYMKCLRTILGLNLGDRVANITIMQLSGQPSIENLMRRNRLRWFGHANRMENENGPHLGMSQ